MQILLSQNQLASRTNRSVQYVVQARKLGLIQPVGALPNGALIFPYEALDAVRGIKQPVLVRQAERATASVGEK